MNNWDDFRFLLAVYKSGTMTAAAKLLNTNVATVSRRIERLSETLGYPPFIKTTHGWEPNKKLLGLLDMVESFDAALQRERNSTVALAQDERVPIRIGVPPVVSSQVLYPSFHYAMDDLRNVGLEFFDRFHGEGLGDYDIVIQTSRPDSGRVLTRRIGHLNFRIYGDPDGAPHQDWVGLSREYDAYPVQQMGFAIFGCEPLIRTHHFDHIFEIVRSSGLPGPLPETLAARAPDLRPLPGNDLVQSTEFWLMYHASRKGDPVIRIVTDWIERCFAALPGKPDSQA
ncbi:LysR family transcriptional regulator [Actibacterium sp. D379-3]